MLSKQDKALLCSYLRSFAAAALACYMAGATDLHDIARAGLAAILPPLLRWLNPNDPVFGRGAK